MEKFWKITMLSGCIFCFIFTVYTVIMQVKNQKNSSMGPGYYIQCVSGFTFVQSTITGDLTEVMENNNNVLGCQVGLDS
jgi:hypothetical protein